MIIGLLRSLSSNYLKTRSVTRNYQAVLDKSSKTTYLCFEEAQPPLTNQYMNKIYATHEKSEHKRVLEVEPAVIVEELVVILTRGTPLEGVSEVFVFVDEIEEPAARGETVHCHPQRHVHAHRCKKIKVTANYAGRLQEHAFSPNASIEKIERWAIDAFGLTGADRDHKELHIGTVTGPIAPLENKIGMYVAHDGGCAVTVFLTPEMGYQG
jgi:hypothetical protein